MGQTVEVGRLWRTAWGPRPSSGGAHGEDGTWARGPGSGEDWGGRSTGPEAQAVGACGPSSGVCGSGPAVSAPQRDGVGPLMQGSVSEVWGGGAVLDLEAPVGWPPVQPDAGTALFCLRALMSWSPVFREPQGPGAGDAVSPLTWVLSCVFKLCCHWAVTGGACVGVCARVLVTRGPWASPWVVRGSPG